MNSIGQTIIVFGDTPAFTFAPTCVQGDTVSTAVSFPSGLFVPNARIRVIVTPNGNPISTLQHFAAPVGIAQQVTNSGFKLTMRNSDCAAGQAAFNWMAVLETPGKNQPSVTVRMAVLPSESGILAPACNPGDTPPDVTFPFWKPFVSMPHVFLTANNLFVLEAYLRNVQGGHMSSLSLPFTGLAKAVGMIRSQKSDSFTLRTRNSDTAFGCCAFSYAAFLENPAGGPGGGNANLMVDTGVVDAMSFNPTGSPGDTHSQVVFFTEPFLTTPIVLLTANDAGATGHIAAPVAVAGDVTPYSFILTSRNSDCVAGQAGYYWVALGCGLGCG
jgi:hypothetical protein